MKTQNTADILRAVAATVVCALAVATQGAAAGATAPPGRAQHLAAPNDVPEGLSSADWQGIRGAYERHRHAIVANEDGTHQARNPGQQWVTRFDGRGFTVRPDSGGWEWWLELTGYGYAGHEAELLPPATPTTDGQRLECWRDDNLTEWFVNDGRGLEQGWTVKERPAGGDERQKRQTQPTGSAKKGGNDPESD